MEQYAISISYNVLAWLATVALLLFARHFLRPTTKLNLPPGPKPWPIIGNFNLIGSLPHRSIHDLSQKYGQIMHLKFGSKSVVVGSSVEMAKVILKTMDVNFICRPKLADGKYTTYNYSDITWSPYGPYWRQARKMCIVELFSVKRLDSYEYIRVEETKLLLKELHKSCGGPIVLKHLLSNVSLNVICRIVVGKRYLDESEAGKLGLTVDEFQKMLDELFVLNGVLNIGDWIPWISFMDLQGYVKRMKAVNKRFDRFLEHVLNEHEERRFAEGESFVPKDMVDHLLQIADDPTLDVKLERHGL
ncbi:cytochrome P450 71A1 [Artemisia annua]|uniref:Cytochrome P450 71A1 n=1 Tax=Artemisia annua TaxID=35608 RepID=A0A2U1N1H6_ARTAN|nr:cytochrome P450 71A1 [Artemisia annua]